MGRHLVIPPLPAQTETHLVPAKASVRMRDQNAWARSLTASSGTRRPVVASRAPAEALVDMNPQAKLLRMSPAMSPVAWSYVVKWDLTDATHCATVAGDAGWPVPISMPAA